MARAPWSLMFHTRLKSSVTVHLILLLTLCAVLFFSNLGRYPFFNKGEPREALVVQDIVHRGSWLLPRKMETAIPSKPPLFHWVGALVSVVWGAVNEVTVRFPSALFASLGVFCIYALASRFFNRETGLLGGVILATSLDYQRIAITARVDMTLTFFITLSLVLFFFLYRGHLAAPFWTYIFYLVLGASILAKGPVSPVLPGLIIVCFLGLRKRWDFLFRLCCHKGVALTLAAAVSWYALALMAGGEEFFDKHIVHENLARFFSHGEAGTGHQKPIYYYVPYLFSAGLPWSLFFPFMAVDWFRKKRFADEESLFLAVWVLVVFVFFSLSAGKRPPYILPLYPPLSLLVAVWFHSWVSVGRGERVALRALGAGSLVFTLILLLLILSVVLESEPAWYSSALMPLLKQKDQANLLVLNEGLARSGGMVVLILFLSSLLWLSTSHRLWITDVRSLPTRLALISLLYGFLAQSTVIPSIAEARSYGPFMREVNREVKGEQIYLCSGAFDTGSVVFYRGSNIPMVECTPEKTAEELRKTNSYFILTEKDWRGVEELEPALSAPVLKSVGRGPGGKSSLILIRGGCKAPSCVS